MPTLELAKTQAEMIKKLEEYYIGLGRVFEDKEAVSILKNKTQISTREILKPYYKAPFYFFAI